MFILESFNRFHGERTVIAGHLAFRIDTRVGSEHFLEDFDLGGTEADGEGAGDLS